MCKCACVQMYAWLQCMPQKATTLARTAESNMAITVLVVLIFLYKYEYFFDFKNGYGVQFIQV